MTQKNKRNVNKLNKYFIFGIILGLIVGFMIGVIVQQIFILKGIDEIGKSWEGMIQNMNVEIDLNETKLVEEIHKIFPEALKNDTK